MISEGWRPSKAQAGWISSLDDPPQLGIIIELDEFGESGLWYHVKWQDVDLWHVAGDIEVISESR